MVEEIKRPDKERPRRVEAGRAKEAVPAGVAGAKKAEAVPVHENRTEQAKFRMEVVRNQLKINRLITQLDTLDFKSKKKVFEWCVKLANASLRGEHGLPGTQIDKEKIIPMFAENGYDRTTGKIDREDSNDQAIHKIGATLYAIDHGEDIYGIIANERYGDQNRMVKQHRTKGSMFNRGSMWS